MSGNTGQHITVEMVVWLPAFLRLCLPWLHDHTRQICYIYACAKLPSGEAVVFACFSFMKIQENSGKFRKIQENSGKFLKNPLKSVPGFAII